ncbi:RICIN domain-containing protein [Streptomyces sp. NPDC006692]|uniref:RICIN domain-containing protein n=1 Tax=Streptomyces sp. NPDC006692 TaxID=3364758 RepID=UPI00367BFACF
MARMARSRRMTGETFSSAGRRGARGAREPFAVRASHPPPRSSRSAPGRSGRRRQGSARACHAADSKPRRLHADKAYDVPHLRRRDRANVQQWTANGSSAQQWWLTPLGDNIFIVSNIGSGKVLDVSDGSTGSGANVQQYEANDSNAQKWRLDRV